MRCSSSGRAWGSPLGPLVRKDDGSAYRSGTEREFDLIWQAREQSLAQSGKPRPAILAYTRRDDETWNEVLDARKTDETLEGLLEQRRLARQFIEERFHDPDGHSFTTPTATTSAPTIPTRNRRSSAAGSVPT